MGDVRREQIDANYKAFEAQLPKLLEQYAGKFALMREGAIIDFFDTAHDAFVAGRRLYASDGLFSIQEVVGAPVDLGFFSHAVS
ncbi:MAG: hypothetical protein HY908_15465 [Myxococcales bacterium]|nr:hypothetical protein [Myxococcales bacterium]